MSTGILPFCLQVLFPWRRIFMQMFNHDRTWGQLYALWQKDAAGHHPIITELGKRCKENIPDYAANQDVLQQTLELQVIPGSNPAKCMISAGSLSAITAAWDTVQLLSWQAATCAFRSSYTPSTKLNHTSRDCTCVLPTTLQRSRCT